MIKNAITSLDMFGHPIQLQIKKEGEYHTAFGILMSVGIFTLIFYSFLSLFIDMIDRKSPSVLQNIEYQANPEEYKLNQDSFLFYLALTDGYGIPITQENNQLIYYSKFSYCIRKVNENNTFSTDCSDFLLKPCDTLNINSQILEKLNISAAVLKASLCFDPDEWNTIDLSLQGTSQSLDFKGLKFTIEKCNNVTSGGNCATQEIIDQKLSSGYLGIFVSDSVLNQQKAKNPFSLVSKLITTTISSYQYKSMILCMRKSKLYNKENFFYYFENNDEYSALLYDHQSEWVVNTQKEELVVIHFILDDREVLFYRTYNNILDILGQMGGLLELMLLCVGSFVKPFNKLSCDLFLASKIFYFEKSNKQQRLYPQPILGLGQEGLVNQSQFVQLKKFFKLKAQQIKLFVHQYIFSTSQNRQLIQQSIESIQNQTDIIFILNKLIEIDKLKKILLNDDQQILFNYIHKPLIQLDQRENLSHNQNLYDQNKLSFEEEIIQALNSYNVIKESNNLKYENTNKTILNLLDKDIQIILEQHENQLQKQQSLKEVQLNDLSIQENRIDI